MVLTVACVKAKPAYDHHWVNRLARMVRENLTLPHRFVCLTDDSSGISGSTKPLPAHLGGWWAKLALFRPRVFDGPVLYLDLDTLIVGNIDFVASYKGDFAILRDFYRPDGYGSGVMLWNRTPTNVWGDWLKAGAPSHPLGDQGWMEKAVPNADRLQDVFPGKFISYKVHCHEKNCLPEGAAVLSFHGTPKNDEFHPSHWVSRIWRGEQIARAA